jgi:rubrerythrin
MSRYSCGNFLPFFAFLSLSAALFSQAADGETGGDKRHFERDRVFLPSDQSLRPIRIPSFFADLQLKYPKTIYALQERYRDEILLIHKYRAYGQKARSEGYRNISYFFTAFIASESIHARNFKELLSDLGVHVEEIPTVGFNVSTTKETLTSAAAQEMREIDHEYPRLIEYIRPENHDAAIRTIIYAWKGERQHRNHLKKVLWGRGIFFGWLARRIEKSDLQFFVCQRCGSTLTEFPEDKCPICEGPVELYEEVERTK